MKPPARGWTILLAGLFWATSPRALLAEDSVPSIHFSNVAAKAGIQAQISNGDAAKRWIAEANGGGVAVLDYDLDGWMDVVLVSGASMQDLGKIAGGGTPEPSERRIYLYRNRDGLQFEDTTADSGLSSPYWATGTSASDYDNDGDVDILVTAIGVDLLFRNEGEGKFTEVGAQAGIARDPSWHTGSSFGDIDADGDLDLFIAGYLDLEALDVSGEPPVCDYRGLEVFCGPMDLAPARDTLYRNNGDGTFTDISEDAGVVAAPAGYGFTAIIEDFNQDLFPDILVANDSSPNFLFLNRGSGAFAEDGLAAGLAYNADGRSQADMGACMGDYDSDGDLDLLTTTFSEDYFPLFRQEAPGLYEDASASAGLKRPTTPYLGWACGFADLDNDGDRDIWLTNGHVYPRAAQLGSTAYEQPVVILENRSARFRAVQNATDSAPRNSYRGAASADFDNDGHVDLVVVPIDGAPLLLHNRSTGTGSWIGVAPRFSVDNVEGIGSRVEVEACGDRQVETIRSGDGYASRSDPRVHFGIGECKTVERIVVTGPLGREFLYSNVPANQWVVLP